MPSAKTFFSDRPIAYHPILAKVCGSVTAALFLSQLAYWSDKGASRDGWIWKTQAEMEDETGLSRSEQETARKKLLALGVLQEERRGVPARMWYLIDWDTLTNLIDQYEQSRLRESCNLDEVKPANYSENTTENTTATAAVEKPLQPNTPNIFKLYENLGLLLNPTIAEQLTEAEKEYPPDWIAEAFKRAAAANVRRWNYIEGILRRWKAAGSMDYPERAEQFTRPLENVPIVNMQAVVLQ